MEQDSITSLNIELEDLLATKPTTVTYSSALIEEPTVDGSNATSEKESLTRKAMAKNRREHESKIRDHIGITCRNKPWYQVDRKVRALIYLTIGLEGGRIHTRNHPHKNVERLTTKELWNHFDAIFVR